jgi:hypothetical protein
MPTLASIHVFVARCCPQIHAARLKVLFEVIGAALHGAPLTLTCLGRGLRGTAYTKHKIKRVDRLLSNTKLAAERNAIYCALIRRLLAYEAHPVILIDWSDVTIDRRWQLLRAALPAQGRSLTLYEEVHPLSYFANPLVQRRFLSRLRELLPEHCKPIVITDAGFCTPWFRAVERIGWQFVGRVRNRHFVRAAASETWLPCKSLYAHARRLPQALGQFALVRYRPIDCALWLVKHPARHRIRRTRLGKPARNKASLKFAAREREPWLLASSLSLASTSAAQIVAWYRLRMQIEEGLRDTKSTRYGFGFEQSLTRNPERLAILLLIAALTMFVCWLIGLYVIAHAWHYRLQANSTRLRPVLSVITIGRIIARTQPYKRPCG